MDFLFSKTLLALLVKPSRLDTVLGLTIKSRLKIPVRVSVAEFLAKTGAQAGWVCKVKVYRGDTDLALLTTSTIESAETEAHFVGTLNLLTDELLEALGEAEKLDAFTEFRIQSSADNPVEVFATAEPIACTIYRSAITGSEGVPTPADPEYPPADELVTHDELDAVADGLEAQISAIGTPTVEDVIGLVEALAEKAALIHTHNAAAITSGVFDPARIPVLTGSRNQVVSSGGIADLTVSQQNAITVNTVVVTTDGFRWVWTGEGSKIDEANFIPLSDLTPSWNTISNKPATFDTTAAKITDATAAGRAFLTALSVAAQKALLALGIGDIAGLQTAIDSKAATGLIGSPEEIVIACSDETTALTTGVSKVVFRMPFAFTVQSVRASVNTAQASGSILTVDINEGGVSILSTKLTLDNTEKTSVTAATPAVISDSSLADDAEISIDIDQIGTSGAKGLKVVLKGVRA